MSTPKFVCCWLCRGVLNVVHGSRPAVTGILDHPDIRAVSFVGSDQAGRYIYERGCANGKRVQASSMPIAALWGDCGMGHRGFDCKLFSRQRARSLYITTDTYLVKHLGDSLFTFNGRAILQGRFCVYTIDVPVASER